MRYHFYIFVLLPFLSFSQVEVNSTVENAKAEFKVVSTGNNKGILIPRMTNTQMLAIASPVEGLLVYNSSNNTFYFYNGSAWVRIGNVCSIIQDNDGDTKVSVEYVADDNHIRFIAHGVEMLTVSTSGTYQNVGNLIIPDGTVNIGTAYSLPTTDGTNKYVLQTNAAGVLSWTNPKTFPGLVAGIQSMPLAMGREYQALSDKEFLSPFIPWSNITVDTIAINVNVVGSPTLELGIYDNLTLLGSGIVSPTVDGFCYANLTPAIPLTAGKLYRFAVVDRNGTATTVLEYPNANNLEWTLVQAVNGLVLPPAQVLKNPIVTHGTSIGKLFWFCAY